MKGHFMGFRQLVQKLERITPIISTLQDKQNEWSFYGFRQPVQKLERIAPIISTLQDKNTVYFMSVQQLVQKLDYFERQVITKVLA